MPQIVQYIDKFAREKNRDVLMLQFNQSESDDSFFVDWEKCKPRKKIITWLEAQGISWSLCALQGAMGYLGHIYLDVPFDTTDPIYQKLAEYLENSDGTMKLRGVNFYLISLADSMKYAEQDEPGYWDGQPDS